MAGNTIFKGDDTGANGNTFITITIKNPQLYPLSKLLVVTNGGCGVANKEFTDVDNFQRENIELRINYTGNETATFNATNTVNVVSYDLENRQSTCPQTLVFTAKNGVLSICPN